LLRCGTSSGHMTGLGHSRPMRSKPRDDVCPLLPESGQISRSSRYVRLVPILLQKSAIKDQGK
jgi:hypothetical protein